MTDVATAERPNKIIFVNYLLAEGAEPNLRALLDSFKPKLGRDEQAENYQQDKELLLSRLEKIEFEKLGWPCKVAVVTDWMHPIRVQIRFPREDWGEALPRICGQLTRDIDDHLGRYIAKVKEDCSWTFDQHLWYSNYTAEQKRIINVGLSNSARENALDYPRRYALLAGYAFVLARDAVELGKR